MYKFSDKTISNPLNIIFLCGSRFEEDKSKELKDKRLVLKEYLERNDKNKPLILEENFIFSNREKDDKLSYKDIDLDNLFKIEALTAISCDAVIIIHETESTAAEMGIFAANPALKNKICILEPHEYCIDRRAMSTFLTMAFSNKESRLNRIEFFPIVRKTYYSDNVSNYHTYFKDNLIGTKLGKKIDKFLSKSFSKKLSFEIKENRYNKIMNFGSSIIMEDTTIKIFLDVNTIKYYIFSLFTLREFRVEIRKSTTINEAVDVTKKWFEEIFHNTVKEKVSKKIDTISYEYIINNFYQINLEIKQIISYSLYILHAIKFITLPFEDNKLQISRRTRFEDFYKELESLVYDESYIELGV